MSELKLTRRTLLKASLIGLPSFSLGVGLAPNLLGCRPNRPNVAETEAKEIEVSPSCPPQDLTADKIAIRENLAYVDQTPISSRRCDNCKLYTLPQNNSNCGGCKVVPGPIHPQGYCRSWYQLM